MAGSDYTHGEMEISEQERTWQGFVTGTVWSSAIIAVVLAYSTFTIAMGLHWMVALALCVIGSFLVGGAMKMGAAWNASVLVMAGIAVIIQIIIGIVSAAL